MRVGVVVGQRREHEVDQVVLHQVGGDAGGVLVALARHAERGAAVRPARGEQVGVEELVRSPHRVAELTSRRPDDCGIDAALGRRVPRAPAVDQVGRARRPDATVLEVLEDSLRRPAQVRQVHVVDGVLERADDPERPAGLERAAVLHVAPLSAVKPVHRRDVVLRGADARGDRRGGHRRDRGEGGDAVAHVDPALDQPGERGCTPVLHGPVEHLRLEGVDYGEDELLRHRRTRRPSYFRSPPVRVRRSSRRNATTATRPSGGNAIAAPASTSAIPSA